MGSLAADLTKLLGNFSLSEEESVGIEIQDEASTEAVHQGKLCLVGRLLADRIMGKETIKTTLLRCWKILGTSTLKVIGENLFIIEFVHSWDKAKVLVGRP